MGYLLKWLIIFVCVCFVCVCMASSLGPSEAVGFQLEVSGLLAELVCPYTILTSGDATQRLLNKSNCLLLLSKGDPLCLRLNISDMLYSDHC